MQRDVTTGKIKYLLTRDGPMYERWARHLTAGAEKYDDRNWMQANSYAELERFRESAVRHFEQWLRGDTDEDHASAVFFNINGAEYVRGKLGAQPRTSGGPFLDPAPGLHTKCRCDNDCEMPCWQLYGLTDQSCGACGCPPFEEQRG